MQELKTQFFTDITHEFRTPLTLILGPVEELKAQKDLSPYAKRQAELIQRNAQRLLRLVNRLMDFRKVEKGKMEIMLQQCDIVDLLNDTYESFKSMAASRSIEMNLEFKQPKITALVDNEKFEKVMFNLLSNAFKYSEDGGKITIRAGIEKGNDSENWLVVEVEDTGIGITEEYKDRIFERFFQTHQKRTHSTGGIGLYLSKTFIEQHGGVIEFDSELGQGTCFRVVVPAGNGDNLLSIDENKTITEGGVKILAEEDSFAENSAGLEPSGKVPGAENNKTYQVLIVEDDNDLNEFIVSGLSSEFNVTGVFNGHEGLEQAQKINPDLIITDIMMPEMNGLELCKALRKDLTTSHIPVVFLTAKTMREHEITGLKLGAVDYIHKPFNLVALKLRFIIFLKTAKIFMNESGPNNCWSPRKLNFHHWMKAFLKMR